MKIELQGVRSIKPTATATVLAADPSDTNSIDEPEKVVPRPVRVGGVSPSFPDTFPPNSVTVLKLEAS